MKRGALYKSERHYALDRAFPDSQIAPSSSRPSAAAWCLSDALIAILLVSTIAALVLGVFG